VIKPGDLVTWKHEGVVIEKTTSTSAGIVVSLEDQSGNEGAWIMWPGIGMRWSPLLQLKIVDETP